MNAGGRAAACLILVVLLAVSIWGIFFSASLGGFLLGLLALAAFALMAIVTVDQW